MVIGSAIQSNRSYSFGGGIFLYEDAFAFVANCNIDGNSADNNGGGLCSFDGSCPILKNCSLIGNTAGDGGGLHLENNISPNVSGCYICGNLANSGCGGGLFCEKSSNLIVSNCSLSGNRSANGGGGIQCGDGCDNALILNNIIDNCITGSGIYTIYSNPIIRFNNVWGNIDGDYGGWAWPGEGDISVDPCFVQPGYWDDNETPADPSDDFWVDGDYHLRQDSLCINAGDPDFTQQPEETDIDGEPRIRLGRVDMGADEAGSNPADFDETGLVDMADYAILSAAWASAPSDAGWDQRCNIATPNDAMIDILDVVVFCGQWLWQAPWAQENIDAP